MKNCNFHRLLHSRFDEKTGARMTTTLLAALAGVGRCHLCQVINNMPGRGGKTRRRLFPYLTYEEIKALGWERDYELWSRHRPDRQCISSTGSNVPNETIPQSGGYRWCNDCNNDAVGQQEKSHLNQTECQRDGVIELKR
jgi:hypothetical protein